MLYKLLKINDQKYELLKVKNPDASKRNFLYRIKAKKTFNDVKKDDLGGYVSGGHNLSQSGISWVYDDSMILDNAYVDENALVFRNSIVCGESRITGNSSIIESEISDNAYILGESQIFHSVVKNNSSVTGEAVIINSSIIDNVEIKNNSRIIDSEIKELTKVFDNVFIYRSIIKGNYVLKNNVIIRKSIIDGYDELIGDIFINKNIETSKINKNRIEKEKSIENNYNLNNKAGYSKNLLVKDMGNLLSKVDMSINKKTNTINDIYRKDKPKIIDEYIYDDTKSNIISELHLLLNTKNLLFIFLALCFILFYVFLY